MHVSIAYAVLYPNDDGSYSTPSLHTSRDCAISSIPVFEGRLIAGIAQVQMLDTVLSGMQLRIQHTSSEVAALPA